MAFELSGTVNLGESYNIKPFKKQLSNAEDLFMRKSEGRYQFLYAGMAHRSFYGIYGKFHSIVKNNILTILSAEFVSQTYDGSMKLDIKSFTVDTFEDEKPPLMANSEKLSGVRFKLDMVSPYSGLKPISEEVNVEIPLDVNLKTSKYLSIEPNILPLNFDAGNENPCYSDNLVDNEHFNQSGVFFTNRNRLTRENLEMQSSLGENQGFAPHGSCIGGYSRIVIAK